MAFGLGAKLFLLDYATKRLSWFCDTQMDFTENEVRDEAAFNDSAIFTLGNMILGDTKSLGMLLESFSGQVDFVQSSHAKGRSMVAVLQVEMNGLERIARRLKGVAPISARLSKADREKEIKKLQVTFSGFADDLQSHRGRIQCECSSLLKAQKKCKKIINCLPRTLFEQFFQL